MCERANGGCGGDVGGGRAGDSGERGCSGAGKGRCSAAARVVTPLTPSTRVESPVDLEPAGASPAAGACSDHERAERLIALGTIAGLIAHEFNNLLTPVVSYSQMALAHPDDRELATKALQKALAGSEKAAQIAEVILGFVREEAAGPDAEPASCSTWNAPRARSATIAPVRSALENALSTLARSPDRDGIRVHLDVPDSITAAIRPVALQHVLLNLLLNARSAMLPGGGELRISARLRAGDELTPTPGEARDLAESVSTHAPSSRPAAASLGDGTAEITIQDTGRGMTTKQIENLFVPFRTYTNHDTAAPGERRRGTGLGMTICKRLVEDAGGYIAVRSAVNQGTTVRIVLPAAGGAERAERPQSQTGGRRRPSEAA